VLSALPVYLACTIACWELAATSDGFQKACQRRAGQHTRDRTSACRTPTGSATRIAILTRSRPMRTMLPLCHSIDTLCIAWAGAVEAPHALPTTSRGLGQAHSLCKSALESVNIDICDREHINEALPIQGQDVPEY
jgi:hypothetical protein